MSPLLPAAFVAALALLGLIAREHRPRRFDWWGVTLAWSDGE